MKINKILSWLTDTPLGTFLIQIILTILMLPIVKYSIYFIHNTPVIIGISIAFGRSIYGLLYLKYNFLGEGGNIHNGIRGKIQPIATIVLLLTTALIVIKLEYSNFMTIQTKIKNIQANELQINLLKPYLPDIKEKRWKPVWKIDIKKDTIKVVNVKKDKTYTFNLSLKEKKYILNLLKELKNKDSTWDNKYHGKDSWYIEIITDKNYIAFTKFLLNATIDNKKEQKTINELLNFIDKKLKSLHIYKNNFQQQNYFTSTSEQYNTSSYTPDTTMGLRDESVDTLFFLKGLSGVFSAEGQYAPSKLKTNYYVKSSGDIIPSKGYRAISGEGVKAAKQGNLMSRSGDTYFTFDNLEGKSAMQIKSELQIKYHPTHYGEFDTLQIIEDIRVPKGEWGTASHYEPIVKDYIRLGKGGATQAVTKTPIKDFKLKEIKK